MYLDKLSKWQRKVNSDHPLLCQIGTKVVAAVIIGILGWIWIKAKPIFEVQYPSESEAKLIFSNEGLLSAYDIYNVATGPTVVLQKPKIISGEEYSKIEEISPNSFIVNIRDLPQNQKVEVGVATADSVVPIGNVTVKKERDIADKF